MTDSEEKDFLSLFSAAWRLSHARRPSRTRTETLIGQLLDELGQRWRHGERVPVEELLHRHPELNLKPEAAVQLIYEEYCLRREAGEEVSRSEMLRRFPQWRDKLGVVLDCHELLLPGAAEPSYPAVGEFWGDFHLLAELGRGGEGRVYLAVQLALADRLVVLKFTPCDGHEHQSLARLQHTHIVPLYFVQDNPGRNLRTLGMPYFGSVTWAHLLERLAALPPSQRQGADVARVLEDAENAFPSPSQGPARPFVAQASYQQVVSWMGACLADALHYAHERGLVHLDVKPSNVLLASDGQPMLLDFHLARPPLAAQEPAPDWLGGTLRYMSPEQRQALSAVRDDQPVPLTIDGRSDIYALGLVLYEALGGTVPDDPDEPLPPLRQHNPAVPVGLADIIDKCLSANAAERYPSAAALADDLRRHLGNLPLRGVANRSWGERYRKWRRRRPQALTVLSLMAVVLALITAGSVLTYAHFTQRQRQAESALREVRQHVQRREYDAAERRLRQGQALVEGLPFSDGIRRQLHEQARIMRQARTVHELHLLVNRLRFLYGGDAPTSAQLRHLEDACRTIWAARGILLEDAAVRLGANEDQRLRADLLDLAILWADWHAHAATDTVARQAHVESFAILREAETLFGPSIVLVQEQQRHAEAGGLEAEARAAARRAARLAPQSAWEHYALGRGWLRRGKPNHTTKMLDQALAAQPDNLWANYYRGVCAYRQQDYTEAVAAFRASVALAPDAAPCYFNRGLAYAALGDRARALRDYDHALRLDDAFAAAALRRGILHAEEKRWTAARADLQRALQLGADPATTYYHLAEVFIGLHDPAAAQDSLHRCLQHHPDHPAARQLWHDLDPSTPR
ncbi:MAG: protein kinase domain-containing protein [Gemmataceae bacterium]